MRVGVVGVRPSSVADWVRERGPKRRAGDLRSSVLLVDVGVETSVDGAASMAALAAIDGLTPGRVTDDGVTGEEPSADVQSPERGERRAEEPDADIGDRPGASSVAVETSLGARLVPV